MQTRAPLPFRFRYRGTMVSLDASRAVGDVPAGAASFRVTCFTTKLAYRPPYRAHLVKLFGWARTGALTLVALLRRAAALAIKLHW